MAITVKRPEEGRGTHLADYRPLISLIVLMLLAAGALQLRSQTDSPTLFMHHFMGFFLVVYSMFKIFDLNGYADGFEMYDLLAKRVRAYAYVYPSSSWDWGWHIWRFCTRLSLTLLRLLSLALAR
jgi:hypothetical protein